MRDGVLLLGAAFAALTGSGASADVLGDDGVSPFSASIGDFRISAGGDAEAVTYVAQQPNMSSHYMNSAAVHTMATLRASVAYDIASDWTLSVHSSLFARSSRQVKDEYGSNFVQKAYAELTSPYGTAQAGMADGASAMLAVGAPVVDADVSLVNSHVDFYRDRSDTFINTLKIENAIRTTYNYSKISYYSPRLFGFEIGVSYTPAPNRDTVPFLNKGKQIDGLDVSYGEGAVKFSQSWGGFDLSAYLGGAFAHDPDGRDETNHLGLTDWAFGGRIGYAIDDTTKVSIGGSFRRKNSYLFSIDTGTLKKFATTSLHLGAKVDRGRWSAGVEYGDGAYKGDDTNYYMMTAGDDPHVGVRAFAGAVSYTIDRNIDVTAGWQEMRYGRTSGHFYNGSVRAPTQAVFLKLRVHID